MLVPLQGGELIIWMLLIIMLYPVLVMGFKDLLAGLLGFMSWPEKP
jgi:nitrate reductase NapE component